MMKLFRNLFFLFLVTVLLSIDCSGQLILNPYASFGSSYRSPEQMVAAGVFASTDYIYWDAERGVTVDGSNNVTAVEDQGGTNKDLAGIVGRYPTLFTDSNGKKWFRCTESELTGVLTNFSTIAEDYNIFFVIRYTGNVAGTEIGNILRSPSGNRFVIQAPTSLGVSPTRYAGISTNGSPIPLSGPIPNRIHVLHFDYTDPAAKAYVNGVLDATTTYTKMTYGPSIVRVGHGDVALGDDFKGDIAKILLIKGTLSDAIKTELRNYFNAIYNSLIYQRFAFLPSGYTDVNITSSVIQNVTGNFDYAAFGSFCIRRTNGKYYRVMMLGPGHNNSTAQICVLQTSTDKGTTWSEFAPIVNGFGVVTNPYGYFTSVSSITIGTGAKTFQVAAGLIIADGSRLMIAKSDDLGEVMHGTVTSYDEGAGQLIMNIDLTGGTTNTFSTWRIWKIDVDSAAPDLNSPAGIFVASTGRVFLGYNKARSSPSWDTRMVYSDDDCVTLTKITGDGTAGLITNDYPAPGQLTGVDKVLEYNGDLYKAFYGRLGASGDREIVIYKSDDGLSGQTWTKFSTPEPTISHDYEEPNLLDLGEDMMIVLMRSDPQATTRTRFSWDKGLTWSTVRQDAYNSIGYNGAVVTPTGGIVSFGRFNNASASPTDTEINYSSRRGQSTTWTTKKANVDDYYYVYGEWDWDYDLNIPAGVYWEETNAALGSGPSRIVFVTALEN